MTSLRRISYSLAFLIMILLVASTHSQAQHRQPENLPKYDLAPYHFGFTLGFNNMFMVIHPVKDFAYLDTIYTVTCKPGSGFNIGIVSNLRLSEYLDLRFIPTLSFGDRTLIFTQKYNDTIFEDVPKKIESAYLNFPFELKIKSKRLYNSLAYVLIGCNFTADMASQSKKKQQNEEILIKLKKNDAALEIGVGFDFYTTYFKFGTELKMMYGVRDMLSHEPTVYANSINYLNSKIFQLTFTFE